MSCDRLSPWTACPVVYLDMKRILLAGLFYLPIIPVVHGQSVGGTADLSVQPGVPAVLATHRATLLRNIVYDLSFRIPIEKDTAVLTSERLTFELMANDGPLVLDFNRKRWRPSV